LFNEYSEWKPRFEVLNVDDAYRLRADLPGLDKKNVDIEITEDILTIKGERKNDQINQNDYSEFTYGKFSRSFNLPDDVKHDSIKASMKDGVLALEIPRMEKVNPKVKRISIK
jgi:HSP20 family protein